MALRSNGHRRILESDLLVVILSSVAKIKSKCRSGSDSALS